MTALKIEPPLESEADSNGSFFEALVYEIHSAALLTVTIASAVNAFYEPAAQRSETSLKPYVPHEPAIITALRNLMIETDLDEGTTGVISDFFYDLAPARMVLDRYLADASQIGDERAATLHRFSLTNSWRKACRDALSALQKLHHDVVRKLSAQYARNSNVLTKLLNETSNGGSPCLDVEGQIRLPDLPQRRRSARRTLCQPCIVTHNRKTSEAFVRDVSSGGLGLERVSQLVPDSIVFVELPSGRRLAGVVAWCDGSTAGIRFAKPLLPNDPLLWG
ncbi:MAG: PilZ domain-containing protein [Hyphomicrobium sp.]